MWHICVPDTVVGMSVQLVPDSPMRCHCTHFTERELEAQRRGACICHVADALVQTKDWGAGVLKQPLLERLPIPSEKSLSQFAPRKSGQGWMRVLMELC